MQFKFLLFLFLVVSSCSQFSNRSTASDIEEMRNLLSKLETDYELMEYDISVFRNLEEMKEAVATEVGKERYPFVDDYIGHLNGTIKIRSPRQVTCFSKIQSNLGKNSYFKVVSVKHSSDNESYLDKGWPTSTFYVIDTLKDSIICSLRIYG